jgi:hypothetical protein
VDDKEHLGKLVSVHGMAPAQMQRAVFIVILSFVFFLLMMFAYYVRQNIGYFLLSSAFLLIYLVTLVSFVMHRRNVVTVHENGFSYKGRDAVWGDIASIDRDGKVTFGDHRSITLPKMVVDSDLLIDTIRSQSASARN